MIIFQIESTADQFMAYRMKWSDELKAWTPDTSVPGKAFGPEAALRDLLMKEKSMQVAV